MNPFRYFLHKNTALIGVLLCAAVTVCACCGVYASVFPTVLREKIAAYDAIAPLAVPDVVLSCEGEDLQLSAPAATSLATLGTVVCATVGETVANGIQLSLYALPTDAVCQAARLCEGRLPETADECLAVCLKPGIAQSCSVGSVITLYDEERDSASMYTVTGIGDNVTAALAAHTGTSATALLLITTDAAPWTDASFARDIVCLQTDGTVAPDAISAAVTQIFNETASAQLDATLAAEEAAYNEMTSALAVLNDAVDAAEIAVQEAENTRNTAALRVKEAENNLLTATDALETERQQFYSDMEKYEYYSSGQLALISRRDLAEESFAEQEAEIAVLLDLVNEAYAALDKAQAQCDACTRALEQVRAEQEAASTALDRVLTVDAFTDRTAPPWIVTQNTARADLRAATAEADLEARRATSVAAVAGIVAILLALLLSCTKCRPLPVIVLVLVSAAGGACLGAFVLPMTAFSALFPTLLL